MDVNILIQQLQAGEAITKTAPEGQLYVERVPPTSTALRAARALQQLMQMHESNLQVIQQLTKDNQSLHEQVQLIQSNNVSGTTS